MRAAEYRYCLTCGTRGTASSQGCARCGTRYETGGALRRTGIAFLLNELQAYPLLSTLTAAQRANVGTHYEAELALLMPRSAAAAAPAPISHAPPSTAAVAAPIGRTPRQAAPRPAPPLPPRPTAPPREFDWSWLAEQQANLFLFAGAFLTVVAALIYVGYSGEAVSGGLKMALLSGYTLAFLAAGDICMRIKRVEAAGRVFFGVGSVLVPLNFVAAYTIFGKQGLSAEMMWLLGSVTTAAFYTAISYIGLGRAYAFAGGVALISAALAASVVASIPVEWAPACFVALALAMSLPGIAGPARLRSRIGVIWGMQAHAVASVSAIVVLLLAPLTRDSSIDWDVATDWFLPITLFGFAAYAGPQMVVTRHISAGIAAIVGYAAGFAAIVFATQAPNEYYAPIFAALAVTLGAAMAAVPAQRQDRLPAGFAEMLRVAGIISTGAAVLVAFIILQQAQAEYEPYVLHSRWFLASTFALLVPFYAVDAFARHERLGVSGVVLASTGSVCGLVYGFDLSPEYYAWALLVPALAFAAAARLLNVGPAARLHVSWRDDVFMLGYGGLFAALTIAFAAAGLGVQPVSEYEMQFRGFLALTVAGAVAFAALDATRGEQLGTVGVAVTTLMLGPSLVYIADLSGEIYAFGFAGAALVLALAARSASKRYTSLLHDAWRNDAMYGARLGIGIAAAIAAIAILIAADEGEGAYEPTSRWFLPALVLLGAAVAFLDASRSTRFGATAVLASLAAGGLSLTYALDPGPETYAFGAVAPALLIAAAARFAPQMPALRLHPEWRGDAYVVARSLTLLAVAISFGALLAADDPTLDYQPATRWFLPAVFALVAAVAAVDASQRRRFETTAGLVFSVYAVSFAVAYALEATAAQYGATMAATAVALALAVRAVDWNWIERQAVDLLAVIGITTSWLAFERAYFDAAPRLGSLVHVCAAFFYAVAAITDRGTTTFARFLDTPAARSTKISSGWLYAAGLSSMIGYILLLRSLPGSEDASDGSTMIISLLVASLAFAGVGVACKYVRSEFRLHLYIMSLAVALVSLATGPSASSLTIALVVYVITFAALSILEDQPLIAAPSIAFGFALVPAWREQANAAWWVIPAAYSALATVLALAAYAVRAKKSWPTGAALASGAFGTIAPIAGFWLLFTQMDPETGLVDGLEATASALYQASTVSVAVLGALIVAMAFARGMRWAIVPGSAVLLVALILQLARFDPHPQAFTAVIGTYILLLGLLGMWKFKLIPELQDSAPWLEALGAAVIMLPSFVQSIGGSYHYQWIMLVEAVGFFALGIVLKRRGILAAAISAMVLMAGRAVVDAVNALPNWIIVAIAGSTLLAIGMAILIGRDRWSEWQERLLGWWDEAGNGHSAV